MGNVAPHSLICTILFCCLHGSPNQLDLIQERNGMQKLNQLRINTTLKAWKILKEMGIPDHLTCILRNLYAGQEATVGTGHRTTDWFQIRKGVIQGCILSLCFFNLYAECIMRNAGLDETQAGIKIAWRNNNNLRYADDITLIAK